MLQGFVAVAYKIHVLLLWCFQLEFFEIWI